MASPINVPGLVEIVGERDLLAAAIAKEASRPAFAVIP